MENKEREDLLSELAVIETMVRENLCGLKSSMFNSIKDIFHSVVGNYCLRGATREQVAKYLNRDVRTLSHWKEKYADFPSPKKDFAQNKTYNWMEIISWKLNHRELFDK